MNIPDFPVELKNVKHAEFASEETSCYRASVYVDGVRAFEASNDGRGGSDMYRPYNAKGRELLKKLEDWCKAQPEHDFGDFKCAMDVEMLIGDLFNTWLYIKDVKRMTKGKICVLLEDGSLMSYKTAWKPELKDRILADCAKGGNKVVCILNELDINEAANKLRESAGG